MTITWRPFSNPLGWGLKRKLIVSMLLVGVVPLLLGLSMAFLQGSKEIQVVSGESFEALATEAARKLDLLVAEDDLLAGRFRVSLPDSITAFDEPAVSSVPTRDDDRDIASFDLPSTDPPLAPRDEDGEDVFLGLDDEAIPGGVLANVAGVKFQDAGTIHEYDAGESSYARGDRVVVESDRGPILATIAVGSRRRPAGGSLRRILRRAGSEEQRQVERNVKREREALLYARERARARNLPIKVVRAEYPLAGQKALFYFVSEERIDFRDLVKDIAARLHGRIEMRQIGARDEAKLVGGIGACGRELCCSTFLPSFAPVSIKMAKDQNLVLNPTKVAGQCGRLKCCLVYENDLYAEMKKGLPKLGKRVRTPGGDGRVVELDVLRQRIRVQFEEGGSEVFPANVVEVASLPQPGGGGGRPPASD